MYSGAARERVWLLETGSSTHNEFRMAARPLSGDFRALSAPTNQYSPRFEIVKCWAAKSLERATSPLITPRAAIRRRPSDPACERIRDMSSLRHILVARAASSVRFAPGEAVTLNDVPAGDLRARIIVQTRYGVEGFSQPIPRELWIEATSSFLSFDQAVSGLTNAAAMVLPAIAFCANAAIDDPEPELAFELVDDATEHKLLQRQVTQERGFPRARRRAPHGGIVAFFGRWLQHTDAERVYRAVVQYSLALRHGAAGKEILALAHYYMAVEALTKALLRDECRRAAMTEDELVASWRIEKKQLDGEIRLRRIFGGDNSVYQSAKAASDGLEHGFTNYNVIRSHAEGACRKTSKCIRAAIFDLVGLPEPARTELLAHPYDEPLDPRPFEQAVRGSLIGRIDELAHKSQAYPCLRWSFELADYLGEDDQGKMQFRPKDVTITPLIGTNAGFQLTSFEVRLPDPHGRVTPIKGTAKVRSPEEVLQDARNSLDDLKQVLPKLAGEVAVQQVREILSVLGVRTRKVTQRELEQLRRKLTRLQKSLSPYYVALVALSGQLHPNIARYFLLERTMAALLHAGGITIPRNADAFDVLFRKTAKGLDESVSLRKQRAYGPVAALRNDLIVHIAAPEHELALQPVLDHWYESAECKKVIHYAQQYRTRASNFLSTRPVRYTDRSLSRLAEQYSYHAGLLEQQLRLLLALDFSAGGDQRRHSDIQEKNFASLLGSAKVHKALQALAQALDRRIRNALAHGVPEINWDRRICVFRDRDEQVEASFDDFFDKTMHLTVTTLCLLGIEQRLQLHWVRQRLNSLLRV